MRSGFLHRAAAKLSRRVVRSYPYAWRERYESEMLALLDDAPARIRDVVDLTRGLVVERVRATFEPGDRPVLLATLVFLVGFARAVTIAGPPILAGWAAHNWLGPLPRAAARSAMLASVVLMLVLIAVRTLRKYSSTANSSEPLKPLSHRAGRIYLGLAMPITFLMSWSSTHIIQGLGLLWWVAPVWDQIAARRPWHVEMARAVHQLRIGRDELKWALLELDRCERLVADGSPAPLQEARDAVEWLTRQRDEALATLHGLGYRATLVRSRFSDA